MAPSEAVDLKAFGRLVREARRRKRDLGGNRWTQQDLATAIGVGSKNTVSAWENGERPPKDMATIQRLSTVLEIPMHALLTTLGLTGAGRVRESGASYESTPERGVGWMGYRWGGPTEQPGAMEGGGARLPPRARAVVDRYLSRMREAGVASEQIDEAERLMVQSNFSKLNKRDPRPRTEEEIIIDIDAAWAAISSALRAEGFRV